MKYWLKKATALLLSGILASSCLTGCGGQTPGVKLAAETDEAQQLTAAATELLGSHSDSAGREETVYVVADAQGQPTQTIVSTWLKNPDGTDTLEDDTVLQNIQNVKGDETFTVGADGHITWQAGGSDIHYQGTTDRQLPVTTAISYELDGKTVSAQELAGATGHLVITFRYTNNTAVRRTVNGKTVTLYQPFLVVSGLLVDNAKAQHVTVTNGKVIQTGERTAVVGMAMPGLRESLGLDTMRDQNGELLDLNVPESVTIEADVEDFSLLTTVTVIDNQLLQDLDLDDVHSLDDLRSAVDQLAEASGALADGSEALYDGVSTLHRGAGKLSDGIVQLDTGAGTLSDGAKSLSDGAKQASQGAADLADGAAALADGNAALRTGAGQLDAGASALADGARQASQGAETLSGGAAALSDGAATIAENMDALSGGLDTLAGGASQVSGGLTELQSQVSGLPSGVQALYNGLLRIKAALQGEQGQSVYEGAAALKNGADALSAGLVSGDAADPGICEGAKGLESGAATIAEGADGIAGAAAQVKDGIDQIPGQLTAAVTSASAGLDAASGQLTAIVGDENLTDEQRTAIQTALAYISGVNSGLAGATVDLTQADAALDAIAGGAAAISSGAGDLQSGAARLAGGAEALRNGADSLSGGAAALMNGVEQIVSDENLGAMIGGVSAMSDSAQSLVDGVDHLTDGAAALSAGADSAASGVKELAQGSHTLSDSSVQLRDGASSLAGGVAALRDGAVSLQDGTAALVSGASDAADGADALRSGARELAGGVAQVSGGADSLAQGAAALKSGTAELKSGAATLTDGVAQLLDGARELKEGVARFNSEGIQKLSDLAEGDAQELVERLRALQTLSREYTSFAGTGVALPASVRFIIRTESIGQ